MKQKFLPMIDKYHQNSRLLARHKNNDSGIMANQDDKIIG